MGILANNTLRYVNVSKLFQALSNSVCVVRLGFHVFTWSDYTV